MKRGLGIASGWVLAARAAAAEGTARPVAATGLPDLGSSLLRLVGALALVLTLFLAGAWLFRNWQRLVRRGGPPLKLNVLEVRPLGQRHALYVVGYERQRLLLAASPAGVSLLSHLPEAAEPETVPVPAPAGGFAAVLRTVRNHRA